MRRFWRAAASVAATGVWSAVALSAQGQGPVTAAQDGFVPIRPGDVVQEQLPAAPLVFAAYAFVWLALATYVFLLWRRVSRVERELAQVSARLQAK